MMVRGLCTAVLVACFACSACGVKSVELLPEQPVDGVNEYVIGEVPADALARLRSQRSEQGDEKVQWLQPLPPELVVPADLAAITFEWRADVKGKPAGMPVPMDMPMANVMMEPQPPAAGQPAPPVVEPMTGPKADKAKMPDKPDKDRPVVYELRAHSELADVRVYSAREAAALPPERWQQLLHAHSGAVLNIALRGVLPSGAFTHAAPLQLRVRPAMPPGLFYSFSPTSQGIRRGRLSETRERFVPVPAPLAQPQGCVGCHMVSRDGRRMLAASAAQPTLLSWSLSNEGALAIDWPRPVASQTGYGALVQGSFDGTAARIAATRGGQLLIFNADTGALLEQSGMPLMAAVSAPDWSPDGRSIVVETGRDALAAQGGNLARVDVGLDGSLSALMPLIEATGDEHLRAPAYSPDSEWIAYERRMGPAGESKDSKLFFVRARGGEPIELRALSSGMRPMDGASNPTFARADEPGHVYLLFSSRRAVGSFVPAEGQRQLFAAELDLTLAARGEDPSHAAFWLPFQQRTNSYLRTQWAPALAECTGGAGCDGDDGECVPGVESCGDGADGDCDGVVDEGCDCGFQEVCGNGADDDCDLRVDEQGCLR